METITIKDAYKNDLNISRIIFGGSNSKFLSGEIKDEFLLSCLEHGVNTFDSARLYGNGKSEEKIGSFLSKNNVSRDKVTIITKCCHPKFGIFKCVNKKTAFKEIEESLKALNISYVDVLFLHRDDETVPAYKIITFMNEIIQKGYTRSIGVSNWSVKRIKEANDYALSHNLVPFSLSEVQFSLGKRIKDPWHNHSVSITGDNDSIKFYTENNIPVLCYSSLADGFFAKYRDVKTIKKELSFYSKQAYLSKFNLEVLNRANEIAIKKNVSLATIALSYCLSQQFKSCCITSVSSEQRLLDNLKALDIKLNQEELDYLNF